MEPVSHSAHRIASLDVLRGLAILLVMLGHYIPQAFPGFFKVFISSWGGAGVLLFFTLSGFLIYRNVQTQSAPVFLTRRFFKLLPAYWVNVLVMAGGTALFLNAAPDLLTFFSNIFLVQEFAHVERLNEVYWTLQIEVKFYVVMALFCAALGAERIYWLLAALLLVNLGAYLHMDRGSTLITYLISFFPGIAAARGLARAWDRRALQELGFVTVVAAANLVIFLDGENIRHAAYMILCGVVIWFGLNHDLKSRVMRFFGKISYSFYLYHTVIGYAVIDASIPGQSWAVRICAIALATGLSIAVATASFYLIEKPGIVRGQKLEAWIVPRWNRLLNREPSRAAEKG